VKVKAAEKVNRTSKIAFMAVALLPWIPYDTKVYFSGVEAALGKGASCFLTSFPRTEGLINWIRRFSKEVIESFK
jgi:hypothetical protein